MAKHRVTIHPNSFLRHYTAAQMAEKLAYVCNELEPRLAELEKDNERIDGINTELCKQWDKMSMENEGLRKALGKIYREDQHPNYDDPTTPIIGLMAKIAWEALEATEESGE